MKHSPQLYAHAFSAVASGPLSSEREKTLVKNFLNLIKKNGDEHQLKKILARTEQQLREDCGRRKVVIETARRQKHSCADRLKGFITKDDIIEEDIDSELGAGLRITVNDELRFDGSYKKRLSGLFKNTYQ